MGLKAGLHIIQQAGKVATGYADDAARLVAKNGDNAVGIFCRKPVAVNPAELKKGLRYAPEAVGDNVKFSAVSVLKNESKTVIRYGVEWYDRTPYTERATSSLYRLTGAKTPKVSLCKNNKGILGIERLEVPTGKISAKDAKVLREDFAADCWLANWDALKDGNVAIDNGKAVRMNVGSSLVHSTKCADFGEDVIELVTFFDNDSVSKKYLEGMTRNELISSLRKVAGVKDDDIIKIINDNKVLVKEFYTSGEVKMRNNGILCPEFLIETLIARKKYITDFLHRCKKSPQLGNESIETYVRRIASEMPETKYRLPYEKLKLSDRVGHKVCYSLPMSRTLTPSQKRIYDEAFDAYKRSKGKTIFHPEANEILTTDCMIHGTHERSLDDILKKGLTSNEWRPNVINNTGEGTATTLSADFWDITSNMSIKDYYARDPQKCANGELGFLYNPKIDNEYIDIAIVVNKKNVDRNIMEKSFLATDRTSEAAKILRKDDNILPHNYPTHRIVPIGVPANTIDRIIVRADIATPDKVSRLVQKIKDSGLDIKLYDTNGKLLWQRSTLSYPRKNFRLDVLDLLAQKVPASQQDDFLKRFGLVRGEKNVLDGIPVIKGFVPQNDVEKEMLSLLEKFYKNTVYTTDPELNELVSRVLKAHPEFAMMMGKTQHGTHSSSVGWHTMKLLYKARKNPRYESLSKKGKGILNHAAVMHDYGKKGHVRTPGHAKLSRAYAEKVLASHDNIPQDVKNRILNLIENHHWFEAYNKGHMSPDEFAKIFPTWEDREIAMILAKADFETVNPTFHLERLIDGKILTQEQYEKSFEAMMNGLIKSCPNP